MSPSAQKRLSAVGTGQANALASEYEPTRLQSFGAIRPSSDGRAPERELYFSCLWPSTRRRRWARARQRMSSKRSAGGRAVLGAAHKSSTSVSRPSSDGRTPEREFEFSVLWPSTRRRPWARAVRCTSSKSDAGGRREQLTNMPSPSADPTALARRR